MKARKLVLSLKIDPTPTQSFQSSSSVCKSNFDYKDFSDIDDQERRILQYLDMEGIHLVNAQDALHE